MFHRECGVLKTSYEADMALYPLPVARWAVAVIAVFFFLVLPLVVHEYYLSIVNLVSIAVVGALGLNILVGYTGQISIGHGAFMSVGAYTAANFAVRLGAPFWIALPAGGLMAAFIGAIVGWMGCYYGLSTQGGGQGLGEATKRSVVTSSFSILVSNYFLTRGLVRLLGA